MIWYVIIAMNDTDIEHAVVSVIYQGPVDAKKAIKWALDEGQTPSAVEGQRLRIDAYRVEAVSTWIDKLGYVVIEGEPGKPLTGGDKQ